MEKWVIFCNCYIKIKKMTCSEEDVMTSLKASVRYFVNKKLQTFFDCTFLCQKMNQRHLSVYISPSPTNCTARRDIVLFSCLGPRTKISQNQALARQYILTIYLPVRYSLNYVVNLCVNICPNLVYNWYRYRPIKK
jgi:hypothetical protein